jgi:drug/metabolite transporter (DMT)-like permease
MTTALFVGTRIVANPVSNVFQKRLADAGADPVFVIAATHALLAVAAVPLLAQMRPSSFTTALWLNMAVIAVLAVVGNVLLVYALRSSDLSVLAPVNAYKAVLSLVLGIFVIGEVPSAVGLAGVLLILTGSYFVVDRSEGQPYRGAFVQFFRERGVQYRFAALACSATEAVFLKRAVLQSSPLVVFLLWSTLGLVVALVLAVALPGGRIRTGMERFRQHWSTYGWLAVTTGLMQVTTLLTFGVMQVGYSLALFQLSTLLSVFFGYRYFHERNIGRRLFGSVLMIVGAVIIAALPGQPREHRDRPIASVSPGPELRTRARPIRFDIIRARHLHGDRRRD